MPSVKLSKEARNLVRRRASREHIEVTPDNLEAYRELARAGVMVPVSTFIGGPESLFRSTQEGWDHREEFQRPAPRFSAFAMVRSIRLAFSRIARGVSTAR
jgi:hypothetical protein